MTNGKSKNVDFEKAIKVCSAIDSFFKNTRNYAKLKEIGGPRDCDDVRMWYDEEYLYIKAENIKEFLDIQQTNIAFSKNIKVTLSEKELIKTYIKNDNKPEYSVHIQKPLYDKYKSKSRYVAFNRERCRHHNLFENIEKIIFDRCQIAVKTQKND